MPSALRPLVPAVVVVLATALLMAAVEAAGSDPSCSGQLLGCVDRWLAAVVIGVPVWLGAAYLAFRAVAVRTPLLGVVTLSLAAVVAVPPLVEAIGLDGWALVLGALAAAYVVAERQLTGPRRDS